MDDHPTTLDADARDDFLAPGGTGVVSVPRDADEPPYTVPVSSGYDAESGAFYFRLAFGADSGKRGVVADGTPVPFVAYEETDDGWWSVVADGSLEAIDEESVDTAVLDGMRRIDIALVDIFDEGTRTLEFHFFRLVSDSLTGRQEDPVRE